MADEQEGAEGTEEQPKPAGSPGKYMLLIMLIIALEGVVGFVLLDKAVPAPEQAAEEKDAPRGRRGDSRARYRW